MVQARVQMHVRSFADRSVEYALSSEERMNVRWRLWTFCALLLAAGSAVCNTWNWHFISAFAAACALCLLLAARQAATAVVEGANACASIARYRGEVYNRF